jgi:Holliday junction resolvase RusA-like endonuclease
MKFQLQEQGSHITFYIPVPKSWPKYKKEQKHLTLHDSVPDIDNCAKAMLDSLLPEDKCIADIRLTKKWVNADKGFIEVVVATPEIQSKDTLV